MRIIGGRDYYDSGLAYGQDESILFLRNGDRRLSDEEMRFDLKMPRVICSGYLSRPGAPAPRRVRMSYLFGDRHANEAVEVGRVRHEFAPAQVVLCGRRYNGLYATASEPYGIPRSVDARWIWSADALRSYARDHHLEVHQGKAGTTQTWDWKGTERRQYDVEVQTFDHWFEPQSLIGETRALLVDQRITIVSFNPTERFPQDSDHVYRPWRVDQPSLGDMQFAKTVDPFTAFQEISMWVGGVLPHPGPNMVEITDDKVKIAKHGFDVVGSFRKGPTKRDGRG